MKREEQDRMLVAHCPGCGPFAVVSVRTVSIGTSIDCGCGYVYQVTTAAFTAADARGPRAPRSRGAAARAPGRR